MPKKAGGWMDWVAQDAVLLSVSEESGGRS